MIYTETPEKAFSTGVLTYQECRGVVAEAPYDNSKLNAEWWKGYLEAKNRKPQAIDDGTQAYGQRPMGEGR